METVSWLRVIERRQVMSLGTLALLRVNCPWSDSLARAHCCDVIMGVDVTQRESIEKVLIAHPKIDTVYHLACVLSGKGEGDPVQVGR